MQAFALPVGSCKAIDRLCREFLWGDTDDKKRVHLVNWNDVCKTKNSGGLGLRKAADFNQALRAKLAWQMAVNSNKLWVQVLRNKYVKGGDFFTAPIRANSSWGWRSIGKGMNLIELGTTWQVGNGENIDF